MANIITEKAPVPPEKKTTSQGMQLGPKFDYHRMAMVPRNRVIDAANHAMFPLQDQSAEEAVLGVATLFAALCRNLRLDPQMVHTMACRVLDEPVEGDFTTSNNLQALMDLVAIRMDGRDTSFH